MNIIRVLTAVAVSAALSTASMAGDHHGSNSGAGSNAHAIGGGAAFGPGAFVITDQSAVSNTVKGKYGTDSFAKGESTTVSTTYFGFAAAGGAASAESHVGGSQGH
jgi:hypothetical protein